MSASAIADSFRQVCHARGQANAVLRLPDERWTTFSELYRQYENIRTALDRQGIGAGSCLVSLVGNHSIFFPLFVACMDAGAVLLPLGEATDAEVAAVVRNAGAAGIVSARPLSIEAATPTLLGDDVALLPVANRATTPRYSPSFVMKLTSGSTDLPKATLAGESALMNDGANIVKGMSIGPDDINLAAIPLSHAYAIGNIVMPLVLQGTAVALRASFNPSQFIRDAEVSGATVFPGVPFMFDSLRAPLEHGRLPASLRTLITAGARIDVSTVRWFHQHAGRKIHSFYGASETGGITYDASDDLSDPLHLGVPLPSVTVEIVEPGSDGSGRVFVRGGGMASGYLNARDDEDPPFQRGGFLTGDLGYLDDQGRLVLTGRVSPLINVAGRKVNPTEVERVLSQLPGVADVRVLGVDCRTRDQELVAFVVRGAPAPTSIGLRQACAKALSPYKIPRRFIFIDGWPVDSRGKVDRHTLEALANR